MKGLDKKGVTVYYCRPLSTVACINVVKIFHGIYYTSIYANVLNIIATKSLAETMRALNDCWPNELVL